MKRKSKQSSSSSSSSSTSSTGKQRKPSGSSGNNHFGWRGQKAGLNTRATRKKRPAKTAASKKKQKTPQHPNLDANKKNTVKVPNVSPDTTKNTYASAQLPERWEEKKKSLRLKLKEKLILLLKRGDTEKTESKPPTAPQPALQADAPASSSTEKRPDGEAAATAASSAVEQPSAPLDSPGTGFELGKTKAAASNASSKEPTAPSATAAVSPAGVHLETKIKTPAPTIEPTSAASSGQPRSNSKGPGVVVIDVETEASPTDSRASALAGPQSRDEMTQSQVPYERLQKQVNTLVVQKARLNEELKTAKRACEVKDKRYAAMSQQLCKMSEENDRLKLQLRSMSQKNEGLKAQLQLQRSDSGLHGASWQFEADGGWEAFTREGNEEMHQSYLEYLKKNAVNPDSRYVTITSGGVARVVDFEEMTQKHSTTKKVRRIRFLPGAPRQWVTSPADLLQQGSSLSSFYIEVTDSAICESITDILRNTGHSWNAAADCHCMKRAKLISVYRIENFYLWHRYKAKLAAMRQDHARFGISVGSTDLDLDGYGDKILTGYQEMLDCEESLVLNVDEKILLHGTSWQSANSIVREGFDHRTCQHGFYGSGVYFASAACKSHQYTCAQHKCCCQCQCERTLIIARVALGDSYVATATRQKERRPPLRSDSSGTHDSIVVKPGPMQGHHKFVQVHQEYVVFNNEQAYPCYVVQYTVPVDV